MKPRFRKLGLFLALLSGGAIVNVAVAWGCSLRQGDLEHNDVRFRGKSALALNDEVVLQNIEVISWCTNWFLAGEEDSDLVEELDPTLTQPFPIWVSKQMAQMPASSIRRACLFEQRGWPFRSLWCQYGPTPSNYKHLGELNDAHRAPISGGIPVHGSMWRFGRQLHVKALPIRPLYWGFAFNTIFYGGILWLLFAGPGRLRRMIRRRRGLCPKCAYPVGVNDRCTECGTSLAATKL